MNTQHTEPAGQLPPDYIDTEHTGSSRELLRIFYTACLSEGGTADEVTLRGLRAAIAADRVQRQPAPPAPGEPTDEELYELWEADGEGDFQDCRRFARDVLARWGRPTPPPQPVPVSERLPGPDDCLEIKNQSWTMHYCWLGYSILHAGKERVIWDWRAIPMGSERGWEKFTHWLPASTRFLPVEVEG